MLGFTTFLVSCGLARNLSRQLRLRRRLLPPDRPSEIIAQVTLALPVRNEEDNLRKLLPELSNQTSLPISILFLDDGSSDGTRPLLEEFVRSHPRLNVSIIPGQSLPDGWRGKTWALNQLLTTSDTDRIIFMDADVRLGSPEALAALIATGAGSSGSDNISFLSVFPRPTASPCAAILVNQIFFHLNYFLPASWRTSPMKQMAAGCGQVMLINTALLKKKKLLTKISVSTHDGLQLAREFKALGKIDFVFGDEFFTSEYYSSFGQALRGFSRNCYEADSNLFLAIGLACFILWIFVLPFILLFTSRFNPWWVGTVVVLFWAQIKLYRDLRQSFWWALVTPISALSSVWVHIWSSVKVRLHLREEWRGRILK